MVCLSVNGSSVGCFEGDSPNGALIPIKDLGTARVTGLCWTPAGRAVASPPLNVDIVTPIPIPIPAAAGVVDPVRREDTNEEKHDEEDNHQVRHVRWYHSPPHGQEKKQQRQQQY